VLKTVLNKSFVLMFVQYQYCKQIQSTFYSLQIREKSFYLSQDHYQLFQSIIIIVYYDLMTKQLICQYQNPSDFGQYHTCADCESVLKIFEDCNLDRCVLLCLAYIFSNAELFEVISKKQ